MKATYQPKSGFSDYEIPAREVTILGFVTGTYEPGYQRSSKTAALAIVADEDGRLIQSELQFLRYIPSE